MPNPVLDTAIAFAKGSNYSGVGDWLDESGNSHDAAPQNAPVFVAAGADSYFTLDGVDQSFLIANHADLNFALADPFTVMIRCLNDDETVTVGWLSKKTGTGTAAVGWMLYSTNSGHRITCSDGAKRFTDNAGVMVDATIHVFAGVRNRVDDDLEGFKDGVGSGSSAVDAAVATLANASNIRIGGYAGGAPFAAGRVYGWAIWRLALSEGDVADAGIELATLDRGANELMLLGVG